MFQGPSLRSLDAESSSVASHRSCGFDKNNGFTVSLISTKKAEDIDNVLWLGKLSEEEKWIRMNSAQIFALPSVYEALPLTALEAMSVGTPVVSFANDGSQFLLSGGGGIVVRKRNAKSLAKAIMFLLENEERMREMGIKAKQVFEKQFSNDKFIDRIRAIYEMGASPVLKSVS